jgi:hypothetical protein
MESHSYNPVEQDPLNHQAPAEVFVDFELPVCSDDDYRNRITPGTEQPLLTGNERRDYFLRLMRVAPQLTRKLLLNTQPADELSLD